MAEFNKDDLRDIFKEFFGRGSAGNSAGARTTPSGGTGSLDDLINESKDAAKNLDSLSGRFNILSRSQRKYNSQIEDLISAGRDLEKELDKLARDGVKISDQQRKTATQAIIAGRVKEAEIEASQRIPAIINQMAGVVKTFGTALINSQTSVVSAIQSGGSGFAIAGEIANQSATLQNMAVQEIGKAAMIAAGGLAALGPIGMATGAALQAVIASGLVLNDLKTQTEIARNRLITTEADKMLTAWKSATSAGAALKGGADDMIKSLEGSVYTLGDYADAVKRNSKELGASNLSVGEASLMFGRIQKNMGAFSKGLQAAGVSYEAQMDIMAQAGAQIAESMPGKGAKVTQEQVEAQTRKYSVQLATLSSLTGESVESLMKKKAADEQAASFQDFLRELGTKGPDTLNAFKAMDPALQKMTFEINRFGGPISKASSYLAATSPQIYNFSRSLSNMTTAGTLNVDTYLAEKKARSDSLMDELDRNKILNRNAYAVGGDIAEATNAGSRIALDSRNTAIKLKDATDAVTGQIEDGANAASTSTTKLFADMEAAGRELRQYLQNEVYKKLITDATLFSDIIKKSKKYIDDVLGMKIPYVDTAIDKIADGMNKFLESATAYWASAVTKMAAMFGSAMEGAAAARVKLNQTGVTPGEEGRAPGGETPPVESTEPKMKRVFKPYPKGRGGRYVMEPNPAYVEPPAAPAAPVAPEAPAGGSSWIPEWVGKVTNSVMSPISSLFNSVKEGAASIGTNIGEFVRSMAGKTAEGISSLYSKLELPAIPEGVKNFGKGVSERFGSVVKALAPVMEAVGEVVRWVGKLGPWVAGAISVMESAEDIRKWWKGEQGGYETTRNVTANVLGTGLSFLIADAAAVLTAAGVTAATGGAGAFGPAELAGAATGIATYSVVDPKIKSAIKSLFDLLGGTNTGTAAPVNGARPDAPAQQVTPGTSGGTVPGPQSDASDVLKSLQDGRQLASASTADLAAKIDVQNKILAQHNTQLAAIALASSEHRDIAADHLGVSRDSNDAHGRVADYTRKIAAAA